MLAIIGGKTNCNDIRYQRLLRVFCLLSFLLGAGTSVANDTWKEEYPTPFELGDGWDTTDYPNAIAYYQRLAEFRDQLTIQEFGKTDSG